MSDEKFVEINIRELANKVSPVLGHLIPGFLYSHFEKLLHLQEINSFMAAHYNDSAEQFVKSVVHELLQIKTVLNGSGADVFKSIQGQNIMVVSNHPLGGPEAVVTLDLLFGAFPEIKLVAQSFLKFIKPLENCCVYNKKDVKTLYDHVNKNLPVLIYPAGYCSRYLSNKEVFDYQWKSSFIKIIKKNKMPLVVLNTEGQLSKRMINWTRFRNFFHIKKSIETIYLVDEMFKLKGSTLNITVSPVIDSSVFDDRYSNYEWAAKVRQYCYELGKNQMAEFNPDIEVTLPEK